MACFGFPGFRSRHPPVVRKIPKVGLWNITAVPETNFVKAEDSGNFEAGILLIHSATGEKG
jgi:hypothetical protein